MSLLSEGKLIAPKGKFRAVEVDTFKAWDADDLIGDFPSLKAAVRAAKRVERPKDELFVYVYDDEGTPLYSSKRVRKSKTTDLSPELPNVFFGNTEAKNVDWRSRLKDEDEPDDDEERPIPQDVLDMLGLTEEEIRED